MVSRVSEIGVLNQNLNQISLSRQSLDRLNYSIATGQNFQELKFYSQDASRIVDLEKDIESRQAYLRSIDLAETIGTSYDTILEAMAQVATDGLAAASPLSTQDADFETTTTALANNFMLEVEANLNIKLGDRFIFAGTNFANAPVRDLRTLTVYNATDLASAGAAANVIETADQLPEHTVNAGGVATQESYMSAFAGTGTIDGNAWDVLDVTINDNQPIPYTLTATDSAFQNLVEGLLRLKSSAQAGLTEDQREEFLADASTAFETARTEIRQLQAENGSVLERFERTREIHQGFITISQTALDDITVADEASVAVQIASLQNQLEASYTTIARQNQLSLVNFLR